MLCVLCVVWVYALIGCTIRACVCMTVCACVRACACRRFRAWLSITFVWALALPPFVYFVGIYKHSDWSNNVCWIELAYCWEHTTSVTSLPPAALMYCFRNKHSLFHCTARRYRGVTFLILWHFPYKSFMKILSKSSAVLSKDTEKAEKLRIKPSDCIYHR